MGLLRWANAFSAPNDGAAIRKRKARQREPAGSPEDQHLRRGVFFSFDSPAVSGSALALPQDARRGAVWRDWIPLPGWGEAMKLRQPREAMPLMVWMALALMAIAAVAYLTGILIMEDILAFFSARK
jgi:hypothetical protein